MDMRGKSNAEFRDEVNEILASHESRFDQILTELQALRLQQTRPTTKKDINPFTSGEASHSRNNTQSNTLQTNPANNSTDHHLKLSFPKFNGDDPTGWIYKAEQYFDFKNIVPVQQVQLASFHLEGIALQWHRWLMKFRGPLTWDEFTKAVLHRFGPTDYEDPLEVNQCTKSVHLSEALTRLKQTSTVAAYQEAFEKLSHQVDGLPKNFLIGCFIAGLHDEIRFDVKINQPKTLAETIGVARLIEERNQIQLGRII
ncbi:hypothetical protein LWI29_006160 [Acer saccharum]|uniref:Retrotransposon gag domain-containing protein n=1 Tax=Acer saccharum TaxID=4024 RepID=A0AA39T7Z0_ACESA|nr:hypothetical protein LWI29_006160 [Acer saccharum]